MTRRRPDVQPCGERHEHYLHCLTCNPPPAENPERLQGPEIGTLCVYQSKYEAGPALVRVRERSYVWAPGDPSYHGGARRYDWKVIDFPYWGEQYELQTRKPRSLVVDDKDLGVVA